MIQITTNNAGNQVVSLKELYQKLNLSKSQYSRWSRYNVVDNIYFTENVDYIILDPKSNRNTSDYIITLDMAKHLTMLTRTEEGHKIRTYFIEVEKAYHDMKYKIGDKKHQIECMALLENLLPQEMKKEQVSYIKANTVVNKCVSTIYGFPKMLKKDAMNREMLDTRNVVLDDYIKLYDLLRDNSFVKEVLYKKYTPLQLTTKSI